MHQDCAGLEYPDRRRAAAVHQCRDFRVRIDRDEAAAELVAVDLDQPGIVFRAAVSCSQQLLKHDGDLDAVRRRQRIELERMAADRQFGLMRGAGDRAVDAGKAPAALLIPGPDFWRDVFGGIGDGGIGHWFGSRLLWPCLRVSGLPHGGIIVPVISPLPGTATRAAPSVNSLWRSAQSPCYVSYQHRTKTKS